MNDLFGPGQSIKSLRLADYLQWASDSDDAMARSAGVPAWGILALPPVQRTALWRPKQMADLWDSIFRGLPIGTLYLVKRAKHGVSRGLSDNAHNVQAGTGWDLLDGQQRTRGLLLGIRGPTDGDKRCLWIDLGARSRTHLFRLHLTSESQPFGYDPERGERLTIGDRRKARVELEPIGATLILNGDRPAFTYEFFAGFKDGSLTSDHQLPDWKSGWPPLPYAADRTKAAFFPLHVLLQRWREGGSNRKSCLQNLREVVGDALNDMSMIDKLHKAFCNLAIAELALLQVNVSSDDLLLLFDRIGAGGTPLSSEERLFSIYKHHDETIHDAVLDIYNDSDVGRVLPPTKIATCAIRIAHARSKTEPSENNNTPRPPEFAQEMRNGAAIKARLRDILPAVSKGGVSERGKLALAFRAVFNDVKYRGDGDIGIPKVMRTSLSPQLLHVLLFHQLVADGLSVSLQMRADRIRFILFWQLCVMNEDKASARCFQIIKSKEKTNEVATFGHMYHNLVDKSDEPAALALVTPDEMKELLVPSPAEPFWRGYAERFDDKNKAAELGKKWWASTTHSLLWLQRGSLEREFAHFDPSSGRDDETPFDVDHIVPRADWDPVIQFTKGLEKDALDEKQIQTMRDHSRWHVGDNIGNKWLVSFSNNRAWGDSNWNGKDGKLAHLLRDESFDPSRKDKWTIASGEDGATDQKRWSRERLETFQSEVELRTAWLYSKFYLEAEFSEWVLDGRSGTGSSDSLETQHDSL